MAGRTPVRIDVALTAETVTPAQLAGATALVIDVLRASTSIIAALASGSAGIVPVAAPEEARRRATALGPDALMAGERRGEPLTGFDLGNSPLEFTPERVGGRTIVLTTSNGTRALLAARAAVAVGVAGFVNLGAAAAWALGQGTDVTLVCSGERGAPSLEDHACAGLLVERLLADAPAASLTPAAGEARRVGAAYDKDVARLAVDSSWARHLVSHGRGSDVAACLAVDTTTLVPVLLPGIDKLVPGTNN